MKCFTQALHRLQTVVEDLNNLSSSGERPSNSSETQSMVSDEAYPGNLENSGLFRVNIKDIPKYQLENWRTLPFPGQPTYSSEEHFLRELESTCKFASNVNLEKSWAAILRFIIDGKHKRWIDDVVKSCSTWVEAKDMFRLKFTST